MTREEFRDYVDFLRSQDEISYDVYSGLIDGIDTLEQEPNNSENPNKWIPVSERLPEKDEQYLVTTTNGDIARYVFNKNGNSLEYWRRCVIAWMPLPRPYKSESEDINVRNQA